jgi:hypothetical protein
MNDENKPLEFDIDKAVATLRAAAPIQKSGRKLSFTGKCAAYGALHCGAKPYAVAAVFGLSETSISFLAGCRTDDRAPLEDLDGGLHDLNLTRGRRGDRRPRYQDVATEFERLGEREFLRRYLTPSIYERIVAAQSQPKNTAHNFKPNPNADKLRGVHDFGEGLWIRVEWIPPDHGWAWCECEKDGDIENNRWKGRELDEPGKPFTPYRTSKDALDGAKKEYEVIDRD